MKTPFKSRPATGGVIASGGRRHKPSGKLNHSSSRLAKMKSSGLNNASGLIIGMDSPNTATLSKYQQASRSSMLRSATQKRQLNHSNTRGGLDNEMLMNLDLNKHAQSPTNILAIEKEIMDHERDLEQNISHMTNAKNDEVLS